MVCLFIFLINHWRDKMENTIDEDIISLQKKTIDSQKEIIQLLERKAELLTKILRNYRSDI